MENPANYIVFAFYTLGITSALWVLYSIVQAFKGKLSWGQARYMGITVALFFWINVIFYLALFKAGFGVISVIFNFPIWIDIALSFVLFSIAAVVFIELSKREKFKPEAFIASVLAPLSIAGVSLVGTTIKEGSLELMKYGPMIVPTVISHQVRPLIQEGIKDLERGISKIPGLRKSEEAIARWSLKDSNEFIHETEVSLSKVTSEGKPHIGSAFDEVQPRVESSVSEGKQISSEVENIVRPSWQDSEKFVTRRLGAKYQAQQSFLNGKEVPYGTQGSIRPDFYNYEIKRSVEVKNYNLQTNQGQRDFINKLSEQAILRSQHLPEGSVQSVKIDVRGQNIDRNTLESIIEKITEKSNNILQENYIEFLR